MPDWLYNLERMKLEFWHDHPWAAAIVFGVAGAVLVWRSIRWEE